VEDAPLAVTDEEVLRALGVGDSSGGMIDETMVRSDFEDEDTPLPEPLVDETSDPVISSNGAAHHEVAGTVESFDGPEPPSVDTRRRNTAPLLTILPSSEKPSGDEAPAVHPIPTAPREAVRPERRRSWPIVVGVAAAAVLAIFLLRDFGKKPAARDIAATPLAAAPEPPAAAAPSAAKLAPPPAAPPAAAPPAAAPTVVKPVATEPTPTAQPASQTQPLAMAPPMPPAARPPPQTYKELVAEARRQRRAAPDVALAMVDRALLANATGGVALVLKAELLLDRERTDAALAVTEKAIQADENNAEAWRTRGKILLGTDTEGAKAALQKYLDLRPNAPDAEKIRSAIESL
jgi:hypothetical protein